MSDDERGYRAILKVNLPPDAQYHSGHSLILQGDDIGELTMMLTAADNQPVDPIVRRILDYARQGVSEAPVEMPVPAAPPASVVLTPGQTAAAMGVPAPVPPMPVPPAAPAPAPAPVVYSPQGAPVPQPAPAPAAAPGQPPQRVDGNQVGGTPGQLYPVGAQVGGQCPKCGCVTYWQPPGTNFQTKQPFDGYWRCPNAKKHL